MKLATAVITLWGVFFILLFVASITAPQQQERSLAAFLERAGWCIEQGVERDLCIGWAGSAK